MGFHICKFEIKAHEDISRHGDYDGDTNDKFYLSFIISFYWSNFSITQCANLNITWSICFCVRYLKTEM